MGQNHSTKSSSSSNLGDLSNRIRALEISPPRIPLPIIQISKSPNTNRGIVPVSRHYRDVVTGTVSLYKVTSQKAKRRTTEDKSELVICFITTRHPKEGHVNGYTFTSKPVKPGDSLIIKVIQSDHPDHGQRAGVGGGLGIGFTSCNPRSLSPSDLPQRDPNDLVDRPEYWVFDQTKAQGCQHGDEFCIKFELTGEIRLGQNGGGQFRTLMHVDHSTPLWAFLSLSGSTIGVRLLGKISPPNCELRPEPIDRHGKGLCSTRSRVTSLPAAAINVDDLRMQGSIGLNLKNQQASAMGQRRMADKIVSKNEVDRRPPPPRRRRPGGRSTSDDESARTVSTLLGFEFSQPTEASGQSSNKKRSDLTSQQIKSKNVSASGIISRPGKSSVGSIFQGRNPMTMSSCDPRGDDKDNETLSECIICYNKEVNSVFLPCGHICLCINCATTYWKTEREEILDSVPRCPMCRGTVTGFIRTFTS